MENQTTPKYSEQITQAAGAFTAFGTPEKIFMDGEDITSEVVDKFGGVFPWLRRLVVAIANYRVTSYAITRINGVVKLYVRSVY
jgi:hypothetical protein